MTIKELKDWLDKYPDTAQIHADVVARNGRGGTFEEQLLFDGSHHDERTNTVYMTFGFEIGWRNAHPEFQTPEGQDDDDGQYQEDTDEALADGGGDSE